MGEAGGNPDAVSDEDERAHRARLRRFSGIGFSGGLHALGRAGRDRVPDRSRARRPCVVRSGGSGVIEPLVLPHAYSHLAPLVGVA